MLGFSSGRDPHSKKTCQPEHPLAPPVLQSEVGCRRRARSVLEKQVNVRGWTTWILFKGCFSLWLGASLGKTN